MIVVITLISGFISVGITRPIKKISVYAKRHLESKLFKTTQLKKKR